MIDYLLTDEQKDLVAMYQEFARKEIAPISKEYDRKGEFPMQLYKKIAETGLTTLTLPEKYGGAGLSHLTSAIITEEIARADAGFAVSVGAGTLAALPVLLSGNEQLIQEITECLVEGGAAAFCLTEASAGSDAAALKTRAVKDGDVYIINGVKTFITNGGIADLYVVFATVDPSLGSKGITAFLVERNLPGVSVGKEEDKMGIRLSNTTEVIFEDVRVPACKMIGEIGQGLKLALKTLDHTRGEGSAAAVGICQAAIDISLSYAKERITFGKPIIANQAIQFMLADMEIQTAAARLLVRHSAELLDRGIVDAEIGSIAKTFAGDTAVKVATDAIQILGGFGYSREYPAEKLLRDAKIFQIFEGTNQIQRMTIAGALSRQ